MDRPKGTILDNPNSLGLVGAVVGCFPELAAAKPFSPRRREYKLHYLIYLRRLPPTSLNLASNLPVIIGFKGGTDAKAPLC